jgi:hypothetical protein
MLKDRKDLVGLLVTTTDMPDKHHCKPLFVLEIKIHNWDYYTCWHVVVMLPDGHSYSYEPHELEPWPFKVESQTLNHIYNFSVYDL